MPFVKVVEVFAIVLVPVAIGMLVRAKAAGLRASGWTGRCGSGRR